jgi:hypothetical protein
MGEAIELWKAERNAALSKLDLAWARENLPTASDGVLLASMHKARCEIPSISDELRHESRRWLEERGRSRFGDLPWPPEGVLEGAS